MTEKTTTERPNVLLICTDHWPASLMEAEDHPCILTPTLNGLCREGTRFTNAYSECPVCVPARRGMMTGLTPTGHGLRKNGLMEMPPVPSLAQTFRNHGYQAQAVGKLHVHPQRDRIGFDEVLVEEEGRAQEGLGPDDYEIFLADHGHAGERFAGGMNNNEYLWRPWHLDERLHVTNWAATQMARTLRRRDPRRPGFWYLSFSHPHPPLAPLRDYLEMYRDADIPDPFLGDWAGKAYSEKELKRIRDIRRAFYALCTHIDHQIRVVLGTLREEGLIDNTILCFTSDHGEMLGNHRRWAKRVFYEDSTRVPMILWGAKGDERVQRGAADERLVCHADLMPTLLDLAGLPVPEHVEGRSMVGETRNEFIFGEQGDAGDGSRMVRKGAHKLIYWPRQNRCQLFDLENDPREMRDLAEEADCQSLRGELEAILIRELSARTPEWVEDGCLKGAPEAAPTTYTNRGLSGQRGLHWPPPPIKDVSWG